MHVHGQDPEVEVVQGPDRDLEEAVAEDVRDLAVRVVLDGIAAHKVPTPESACRCPTATPTVGVPGIPHGLENHDVYPGRHKYRKTAKTSSNTGGARSVGIRHSE